MKFIIALLSVFIFVSGCSQNQRSEVKKMKVGDIELAYYTRGSGEPLVMIMGFAGTMGIWDPVLLEALEKHFTLILFDNRGVGLSTDTQKDLTTISQMAEDTVGLIRGLGYQSAYVLGWSMGSRVALQMGVSYPELVKKLILCSPNPGKNEAPRRTNAYAELTGAKLSKEQILKLIFPETDEGRKASKEYVLKLTEAITTRSVPDDLSFSEQAFERQKHAVTLWSQSDDVYNQLPKMKAPTLVTGGLSDVLDPPENVHIVASKIPYAWTAYFAGAGHAFMFQDAKQFADLVVLFIKSSES